MNVSTLLGSEQKTKTALGVGSYIRFNANDMLYKADTKVGHTRQRLVHRTGKLSDIRDKSNHLP